MTFRNRFLAPAFALFAVLPLAAQGVDTYQVDPAHSTVGFKIRHLISKVPGTFAIKEGKVRIDLKDIAKSSVEVTLDAGSVSTGVAARDGHLKGADFFDVAKYPTITFRSTEVKEVAKGQLQVTGQLTLHGVTRTLTVPVTNLGTAAGMKPGSVVAGFEGAFRVNRSDYGMKFMVGPLGDEVEITLNIEAGKIQ